MVKKNFSQKILSSVRNSHRKNAMSQKCHRASQAFGPVHRNSVKISVNFFFVTETLWDSVRNEIWKIWKLQEWGTLFEILTLFCANVPCYDFSILRGQSKNFEKNFFQNLKVESSDWNGLCLPKKFFRKKTRDSRFVKFWVECVLKERVIVCIS